MISGINVHRVESIKVEWLRHGESTWQKFTFHGKSGETFEVNAFVEAPTPIEGAEMLALMAREPSEA